MLREQLRFLRLDLGFTQAGLAAKAEVSLSTLRKFEREGAISLTSYLKLLKALGALVDTVRVREPGQDDNFNTIEDVLAEAEPPTRRRGRRS